jgi:Trp operon repressor
MNKSSVIQNQYKIEERRRQVANLLAKSMTERQIASQLNVSQPTVHRDVEALKQMSQQFVYELARSDLAYFISNPLMG